MIKKIFDYYTDTTNNAENESDHLYLEIGNSQVACMGKSAATNQINSFELFVVEGEQNSLTDMFFQIRVESNILNRNFKEKFCYYQMSEAIAIPSEKFSLAAAEDYLSLVYGASTFHEIKYEAIEQSKEIIIAYRITKQLHQLIGKNYVLYHPHHTYTSLLNTLFAKELPNGFFVKVQFYQKQFIIAVMKNQKLQFIQTFGCQVPEDLLYHVMNVRKQLAFNESDSHLEISGMIDLDTIAFQQLSQSFNSISIENIDPGVNKAFCSKNFPLHYFTPFYKLTL